MKKIWFAVLVLLVSTMLAGCQESETMSFKVEVVNVTGTVLLSESIIFAEDDEETLIDLVDEQVGLDYSVYDIGVFVNGVGGFYPTEYGITYNYYYSLFVDGIPTSTGIQDLDIQDDMSVSFVETTMLDETDLEIDRLIQVFIENHYSTYVNNDTYEHYVLAAIEQLGLHGYQAPLLSSLTLNYPSPILSRTTIAETFKTTVFEKAYDLDLNTTKTALAGFEASNPYDAISLLTALSMTEGSSEQIVDILDMLTSSTPAYMDADYAGMLLLALAPYREDIALHKTLEEMVTYIQTMLSVDGVESWGNANSSSTATVILGLVAQGINPRGENYTTSGTDLIEALLKYESEGAYKWLLDDEQANMAFSTPQVFSALVAYKIYRDIYGNPAFNLFGF